MQGAVGLLKLWALELTHKFAVFAFPLKKAKLRRLGKLVGQINSQLISAQNTDKSGAFHGFIQSLLATTKIIM